MIAIKGMEMPKSCYECGFRRTRISDDITHYCNLINTNLHRDWTKNRHPDCPLVEIITCKDCKHKRGHACLNFRHIINEDFFCGDGERRE